MTSTRRRGTAWATIALALLLALGAGRAGASSASAPVYRVVGLVLEQTQPPEDAHGPQLCLGVIPAIYPPRCAGIGIAGWDWATVDDEQSFNGTTWGRYVVIGTFDGTTITLTRPPRRAAAGDGALANLLPDFRTPCRAPAGGWIRRGQGNPNWNAELGSAAHRYLNRTDDLGGEWVDHSSTRSVVNVRVVRNVATHRVRLRQLFRGNLCVIQRGRSRRALGRILNLAIAAIPQGNRLGGLYDVVDSHVDVDVVLDAGDLRRSFDTRFGPGAVRVRSALLRVG